MYQLVCIRPLLNDDKVRLSTPNGFVFSIFVLFFVFTEITSCMTKTFFLFLKTRSFLVRFPFSFGKRKGLLIDGGGGGHELRLFHV